MALSEREQQMLEEMEQALYAEDPRFASQMQGTGTTAEQRRRRLVGAAGTIVGLGLVILGISTSVWVGVAGFGVIVAALAYALAPQRQAALEVVDPDGSRREPAQASKAPRARRTLRRSRPQGSGQRPAGTFMQRLERRWDDRRGGGI